jgi:uncharacterized protein (DUF2147 family)
MKQPRKTWHIGTMTGLLACCALAPPALAIEGYWQFKETGEIIQFSACGSALCAKIAALAPEERQSRDVNNPDPALRRRPLCGLPVIEGLKARNPGRWVHGSAYSPEDGNAYDLSLSKQEEGTLVMKASVKGLGFLAKTYVLGAVPRPGAC